MIQDTDGEPGLCALSVLDTRLLDDWGQRLAVLTGRGGRLLVAGNGGSAAQAERLAAQFAVAPPVTGHAAAARRGCPAIALQAAAPAVTAIASDGAGQEEVFACQVRALGRPGDVLLTVSAAGRNNRLLRAVAAARAGGIVPWCLTGPAPNPLADVCDEAVCVYPAGARALSLTATVQEAHQVALHLICQSFSSAARLTPGVVRQLPPEPYEIVNGARSPG
jgi:D-sedoheptulose 7-phosphate isomerase